MEPTANHKSNLVLWLQQPKNIMQASYCAQKSSDREMSGQSKQGESYRVYIYRESFVYVSCLAFIFVNTWRGQIVSYLVQH